MDYNGQAIDAAAAIAGCQASELFRAGHLQAAIDAQVEEIKSHPDDANSRLFLFELLALAGQFERAAQHLAAVEFGVLELDSQVNTYRRLLAGESKRQNVFNHCHRPALFAEASPALELRMHACALLQHDRPADAAEKLSEAAELETPLRGSLGDRPFSAMRDCDDLFGSVFEMLTPGGEYYWVPGELISRLQINRPRYPRDLVWVPCRMELATGPSGEAFLPACYPYTHCHVDEQVRMGRLTDWTQTPAGTVLGQGVRTFLIDDDAVNLFELSDVRFDTVSDR